MHNREKFILLIIQYEETFTHLDIRQHVFSNLSYLSTNLSLTYMEK